MRLIASIILAIIVMVEIFMFINADAPMKVVPKDKPTSGLFGKATEVIDEDKQSDQNTKYAVVIGSTILIGGIIIFSIPQRKSKGS